MELKDILDIALFDVILEGLGLLIGIGAFIYIVFGESMGTVASAFGTVFCGSNVVS